MLILKEVISQFRRGQRSGMMLLAISLMIWLVMAIMALGYLTGVVQMTQDESLASVILMFTGMAFPAISCFCIAITHVRVRSRFGHG